MTNFNISVVIPVHNGERHIAETLRCVLAQSLPPFEVIVVDDGSDDGTFGIVSDFSPRVRIVCQVKAGPSAARNAGIRQAKGDLIAFVDHDDLWRSDKLMLQAAAFAANSALDVCVAHIQRFRTGPSEAEMELLGQPAPGYLVTTMLARRSAFDRVGLLNSAFGHSDHAEWFLRARDQELSVRLLPDVLTFHRDHETNRSRLLARQQQREYLRLAKLQMDKLRFVKGQE